MKKYRKKPVVVEAIQITNATFDDPHPNPDILISSEDRRIVYDPVNRRVRIETLEGVMTGNLGDWIIRGVRGELYPCKPDIFEATYELVTAPPDCSPSPRATSPQEPSAWDDSACDWRAREPDRLMHAIAALRCIARTCVECPETASFASAAAFTVRDRDGMPGALAPTLDYNFPSCRPDDPCFRDDCGRCLTSPSGSGG